MLSEMARHEHIRLLGITGGSGAGKTTLAKWMEAAGWMICSPGKSVRQMGIETSGELAPKQTESIVRTFVLSAIESSILGASVVLDGFPRSQEQARWLDQTVAHGRAGLVIVRASQSVREARVIARMDDHDSRIGLQRLQYEAFNLDAALESMRSVFPTHRTWEIDNE